MSDQTDQEKNEEDVKEDLGDARGSDGNARETEHGCDDRDDEKNECPSQHDVLLIKEEGIPFFINLSRNARCEWKQLVTGTTIETSWIRVLPSNTID